MLKKLINFFDLDNQKYNAKVFKKIPLIEKDLLKVVSTICTEDFWIHRFGGIEVSPEILSFCICVQTDRMKLQLKNNDKLWTACRQLLVLHDYPSYSRDKVWFDVESQETVDRENDGVWFPR